MSRVKLDLPHTFNFATTLPVRITNINYGNHLGHDALISLLHEARIQFLRKYNYLETDIEGVGFVISDLVVEYKNEAFYGDELRFELAIHKENKKACAIYYRVTNLSQQTLVAKAKTGVVFYDFKAQKSVSVPSAFIETFDL